MNLQKTPICFLFFLIILSGCFREYEDSRIWKEKDIVLGMLTADSSLNYRHPYPVEIYVGRMIPGPGRTFLGMVNPDFLGMVFHLVSEQMVELEYDSTASVQIHSSDQTITLPHLRYGVYADTARQMKIKAGQTYSLTVVKSNGKQYTAQTVVPGYFNLQLPAGDTIPVTPDIHGCATYALSLLTTDTPAYVIRLDSSSSALEAHLSFPDEIHGSVCFSYSHQPQTRRIWNEIRLVNKDLAPMTLPLWLYSVASSSDRFVNYRQTVQRLPLQKRSNIRGENVVGAFGACHYLRRVYFVREQR